jgi:hydroxyacylglutathione hydrolase
MQSQNMGKIGKLMMLLKNKGDFMQNTSSFSIHNLLLGPMENFIYIIQDNSSKKAAVIDPAWDIPEVIALAKQQNLQITDILLTHSHHDHINGLTELLNSYDAQLHLLKAEAQFWGHELKKPSLHHGGDSIQLGKTQIEILHTPGHTPGSACFYLDGHLITGDTLFVFGCGRCDLNGGNPEQMYYTLKKLGAELPANTIIHPGHHYAYKTTSTMVEQLDGNPFMHFDKSADFVHYRMHQHNLERQAPYSAVRR